MLTFELDAASSTNSPFVKGNRVVAKFETNIWLVGTVSANRLGRVYIKFDNGEIANYAFATKNVKQIKMKRKLSADLNSSKVKKLLAEVGVGKLPEIAAPISNNRRKKSKTALDLALPKAKASKVIDALTKTAPKVKVTQKATPIKSATFVKRQITI